MTHEDHQPAVHEVERLLHAGGRRPMPNAARREVARDAVHGAWRGSLRARARRKWMRAGVPALAAAAVLAVAVWLRPSPAPVPPTVARIVAATAAVQMRQGTVTSLAAVGDEISADADVETAAGVVMTVALRGGGELRQDGGTAVRWTAERRLALRQGRIYIDTAAATSPLLVETPAGLVRDIGTQFEVDARGGRVRVRVREGAVRFESADGHHQASAGRELVAETGAPVMDRRAESFGAAWDWILQATPFRLEGATVERFTGWVEREGGLRIEYRPASLRDEVGATQLHGSIRGLSMNDAIATALPAAGLTHHIEAGTVIIERPRRAR